MSIATMPVLPGAKIIAVPCLPDHDRIAEVEALAHDDDATPYMVQVMLQAIAAPSLTGEALTAAWARAVNAIGVRDATDEDDGDFTCAATRAEEAIENLIYGLPHKSIWTGGTPA